MAYYYVDDIEASLIVVYMLQACSKYVQTPMTVADGEEELCQKLDNLNKLYMLWTADDRVDDSYQSEVYKEICEMFSKNVFRNVSVAAVSREEDDEISVETMWEFKQLKPVYRVFAAFLRLKRFDAEKLARYADETFVGALIRRLDRSRVEAERHCAKRILFRLFDSVLSARAHIVRFTVNSLASYDDDACAVDRGGVSELLELFELSILRCRHHHRPVDSSTIVKVLSPLITRNGLCHYSGRLLECIETAARVVDADLPTRFVDHAIGHWSAAGSADVPSLCRTLAALYFDDAFGPERRGRVRGRLMDHVAGRLRRNAESDGSSAVAACRAYVEFLGRLMDDAMVDPSHRDVERAAEALVAVHRTHRDYCCVEHTDRLLRRLVRVSGSDGRRGVAVGDACRLTVMEALVEDRLRKMTEDLVDNTF